MMASRTGKRPPEPLQRVRCAIYCRKSNTEGLDGDFSSLDAQRDACASYVQSQAGLGWVLLPERYDDGGYSGGTMDRPALQRLLADLEAGRVDCIVLYRLDRLSRSLIDFAKIVEILERHGASFVSVTESFSTATSTGRLHLHMILAFAQYERELAAEGIRDKVSGAKKRGKHCGGMPILGYDTVEKKLVVNQKEAKLVRRIFRRFVDLGSATALISELSRQGHRTKAWTTVKGIVRGGGSWSKPHIYALLNNPKYLGLVEHHGKTYPGEHQAIVPQALWDEAHRVLSENHTARSNAARAETPAILKGLIFCKHCGHSMGPTWSRKDGRSYRYYLCVGAAKNGYASCPVRSVSAGEVERAVVDQLRAVFRAPELVARTFREAKAREQEEIERLRGEKAELERRLRANGNGTMEDRAEAQRQLAEVTGDLRTIQAHGVTEREVIDALRQLDPVWDELFPAERARIVSLLVARVDVQADGLELRLRADGLQSLVAEVADERDTPVEAPAR